MEEFSNHGQLEKAALKAGMNRKTAAKYMTGEWRVRKGPFTLRAPTLGTWWGRSAPSGIA